MSESRLPLASTSNPVRSSGITVGATIGSALLIYSAGPGALVIALPVFLLAITLSLNTAWSMRVYPEKLVLRLGPFGLIRRTVSRDDVTLRVTRNLLVRYLTIRQDSGPILWPFLGAQIWDAWPEDALRRAGYYFTA